MGLQHATYRKSGRRVAVHDRKDDLFLPPSMNHRDCNGSTDTTFLVNPAPTDIKLIGPPWRIPVVASTDDSTEVGSRDRYLVVSSHADDERDQAEAHAPPSTSLWMATTAAITLPTNVHNSGADERQEAEHATALRQVATVDSLELISLPPSVRKPKKSRLFKKLKKGVTRVSSRLDLASVARLTSTSKSTFPDSGVEVRLLAWTEYKITVQIIDGGNKTKIQMKRDHKEIEAKLPKIVPIPYEQVAEYVVRNDHQQVEETVDDYDVVQETQQEPDEETLATIGPDDIPHEVSYRTMPSIHSIVFQGIPPAASIPDVSDVSSNSSDASDFTESDDEEDFFACSTSSEAVPAPEEPGKLKKWNKKLFAGRFKRRSSAE